MLEYVFCEKKSCEHCLFDGEKHRQRANIPTEDNIIGQMLFVFLVVPTCWNWQWI